MQRHLTLFMHASRSPAQALLSCTLLCLCLLLAGCGSLRREFARLPEPLSASLSQAGIPDASVALEIRAVDGERLVVHNASQAFNPASVMKLVTTAAALDLLGPAHRWFTRVHADGMVQDGILQGDLYLEGGGDPRFAHEDLSRLLRRLRAAGIREIRGDLVLDRRLFLASTEDPAAFDAAPLRAYNAAPDALLLDARALSVRLLPDPSTGRAQVSVEPPMHDFSIEPPPLNDLSCQQWREQLKPVLTPQQLRFEGSYSISCGERLLALHAYTMEASQFVDAVFRQLWAEQGGVFTGRTREGSVPGTAREMLIWESQPLSDVIRDINKHSNNVMARQLLLSLAAQRGGAPATAAAGAERVLAWMTNAGIDARSVVIENGSGLSRRERISAQTLSDLLLRQWRSPLMPEFVASLPLAGIDGTMSRRVQESGVRGRAHIKTGSLADVASIAGYLTARSGRRIIISCMINHPNASAARAGFDPLLDWIYERY